MTPQQKFEQMKYNYQQICRAIAAVTECMGDANYANQYLKDEEHHLKTLLLTHIIRHDIRDVDISFLKG